MARLNLEVLAFILFLGSVLLLAGCGTSQSAGDQYLQRLSEALDRPVVSAPSDLIQYPARRILLRPIASLNISVAEFARLHACDMGGLIGARNGSLARLATDSQRLLYELAWLQAAQVCIEEGHDWLTPLRDEKTSSLPDLLWNATFASAEMSQAMGHNAVAANHSSHADEAFRQLADLIDSGLAKRLQPLESHFENTLRQLTQTVRIGERRRYWSTLRAQLQAASAALTSREPAVCLSGQPNDRSRRLFAVFQRYYVSAWQTEFSRLLSADERWLGALARSVELLQTAAPVEFANWYNLTLSSREVSSEWQLTKQAVTQHVQAWQVLFEQCGIDLAMLRGTT